MAVEAKMRVNPQAIGLSANGTGRRLDEQLLFSQRAGVLRERSFGEAPTTIVFPNSESLSVVRDVQMAWQYLSDASATATAQRVGNEVRTVRPTNPAEIIERLKAARETGEQLTLVVPWGTRVSGDFDTEADDLEKVASIQRGLVELGIPAQTVLLAADTYATDIDGIDTRKVAAYFERVTEEAQARGIEVVSWSDLRRTFQSEYDAMLDELLTKDRYNTELVRKKVPPASVKPFVSAAARWTDGNKDWKTLEQIAYEVVTERICEAQIIELAFPNVIKLSVEQKGLDRKLDGSLPSVYLGKPGEKAPWVR